MELLKTATTIFFFTTAFVVLMGFVITLLYNLDVVKEKVKNKVVNKTYFDVAKFLIAITIVLAVVKYFL